LANNYNQIIDETVNGQIETGGIVLKDEKKWSNSAHCPNFILLNEIPDTLRCEKIASTAKTR
jgi:hypothetical protein